MLPQNKPDRIRIVFDDHRLVANAGLAVQDACGSLMGLRLGAQWLRTVVASTAVSSPRSGSNAFIWPVSWAKHSSTRSE